MKVVLFCGGRGLRLREHSEVIPKPMVPIGYRPILWHVMRYYAHFGHRDFILCLGYRGDAIKDYFLHYDEAVSNDFVLSDGGRHIELLASDIADWRITFADTGSTPRSASACAGCAICSRARRSSWATTATPSPTRRSIAWSRTSAPGMRWHRFWPFDRPTTRFGSSSRRGASASMRCCARAKPTCGSTAATSPSRGDLRRIHPGDELVEEPFARLIAAGRLHATRYEGFWGPLDTLRDLELLEELASGGQAPWESPSRETVMRTPERPSAAAAQD